MKICPFDQFISFKRFRVHCTLVTVNAIVTVARHLHTTLCTVQHVVQHLVETFCLHLLAYSRNVTRVIDSILINHRVSTDTPMLDTHCLTTIIYHSINCDSIERSFTSLKVNTFHCYNSEIVLNKQKKKACKYKLHCKCIYEPFKLVFTISYGDCLLILY